MRARWYCLVSTLAAVAACGPSDDGSGATGGDVGGEGAADAGRDTGGGNNGGGEFVDAAPAQRCEKMDILFVVDDSASMLEEQDNLAENFPLFINVLEQQDLDYRVAVTTTGRNYSYTTDFLGTPIPAQITGGANGELLQRCNMQRQWVEPGDPDPAGEFGCAAQVGTDGPTDEMPLSAMRMAFEERMQDGTNAGFRRDDALLAIVFLTDEDDCSYEESVNLGLFELLCESQLEPATNYVDFLDQYTGDRGRWAAAVIAGAGPGRCSSDFGAADEATRLIEFASATGANAVVSSICEGDLTAGLQDALDTFDQACQGFPPVE